jgi:serine/threonine-protein kinase
MGVVLAAQHLQLPQRVAIKFIRADAARDPNAVERFLREARAAAALSSEHVTRVIDVGTLETGLPYMVMEYLEGTDLARLISERGPMPVVEAVDYILQACQALAEAHAIGIVHRDLKPANLFLNKRRGGPPIVKVLDFGISKFANFDMSQGTNLTASGLIMGSPGYMSPEQVRSAKGVDATSDIWSLGVILYEFLASVPPFPGETIGDTLAKIVTENPKPILEHRPDLPSGLAAAIARCLERNAGARFQSVSELAAALLPFAPGEVSAIAIKRILRLSGRTAADTMTASSERPISPEASDPVRWPTGRPWLRSTVNSAATSKRRLVFSVGAVMVTVGLAALIVLWVTARLAPPRAGSLPAPDTSTFLAPVPSVRTSGTVAPTPAASVGDALLENATTAPADSAVPQRPEAGGWPSARTGRPVRKAPPAKPATNPSGVSPPAVASPKPPNETDVY